MTGFILFNANRISNSIPYLAAVNGEHLEDARPLLAEAYLRTSDFAHAQQMLGTGIAPNQQPFQPTPISAELRDEMNRARWRAEIGPNLKPPR